MGKVMTTSVSRHSFGWFEIDDEIISTVEARVFSCDHKPANRSYLLRVPPEEAGNWQSSTRQLRLRNAELELPNVRATVAATGKLYTDRYFGHPAGADSDRLVIPEYYGVLDDHYLIPVSAVYRRRGSIPFEDLLVVPSALFSVLPFWENLWLLLTSESALLASGTIAFDVWKDRWQHLIRGSQLGRQLIDDMPAEMSDHLGSQIEAIANDHETDPGPPFEESIIIRLITSATAKQLTEQQVAAALSCPFFRMNVTIHDLHYAVALINLTQPQDWLFQSPIEWLGPSILILPTIVRGLLVQPSSFPDDSDAFERCPPPDEAMLTRFSLFLRDPERTVRPYLALERA
jgi:hypothetical protein